MKNFPIIFNSNVNWSPVDPASELYIQASCVDQALCDEAEAGRAHGATIIKDGALITIDQRYHLKLNQECPVILGGHFSDYPLDCFMGGAPLIEDWSTLWFNANNQPMWCVSFPYLRASVADSVNYNFFMNCNGYDPECAQAKALGAAWNISGKWGDKNRLHGEGNWHEDKSMLTTIGDYYFDKYAARDASGTPQYLVEICGTLLLPFRYLKRGGFQGPRRVFFPPEDNIAIWYFIMPNMSTKNIFLASNPFLMLAASVPQNSVIGCLPGGAASVGKTDLSTLNGRTVDLMLANADCKAEVELIVKLAARLRRDLFMPDIVIWNARDRREIGLSELNTIATKHQIFFPPELRPDYFGDVTLRCLNEHPTPVIDRVLNAGDLLHMKSRSPMSPILFWHIVRRLNAGVNVFGTQWRITRKWETLVLQGNTSISPDLGESVGRIADCRFLNWPPTQRIRAFASLLQSAKVVLITASELIVGHSDICLDVVQYCREHHVAVMLFFAGDLPEKLRRVVDRTITVSETSSADGYSFALAGETPMAANAVEVTFNADGELAKVNAISQTRLELLLPSATIPSPPPNFGNLLPVL